MEENLHHFVLTITRIFLHLYILHNLLKNNKNTFRKFKNMGIELASTQKRSRITTRPQQPTRDDWGASYM